MAHSCGFPGGPDGQRYFSHWLTYGSLDGNTLTKRVTVFFLENEVFLGESSARVGVFVGVEALVVVAVVVGSGGGGADDVDVHGSVGGGGRTMLPIAAAQVVQETRAGAHVGLAEVVVPVDGPLVGAADVAACVVATGIIIFVVAVGIVQVVIRGVDEDPPASFPLPDGRVWREVRILILGVVAGFEVSSAESTQPDRLLLAGRIVAGRGRKGVARQR